MFQLEFDKRFHQIRVDECMGESEGPTYLSTPLDQTQKKTALLREEIYEGK